MLVTILGSYAHAANPKLLNAQDNSHDVIIYDLKGRRLSFIDEGPKRGHEATERLKQLTGGGSLTGRPMRGNPVTSRPTHTFVMTTNNEPHLTDPAIRARIRLIPCNADEADVRPARLALLGQALHTEAPGILAAMMRETAAYLADRDSASAAAAPIAIRGLSQEIAEKQDPAREWVETCAVPADPGTPGRALYTSFAAWHQNNPLYRRMSVPTENAFGRTLTEMGYPPIKVAHKWHRSLSVLSGPAGVAPWEPVSDTHMTRGSNPQEAVKRDGGGLGGGLGRIPNDESARHKTPAHPAFFLLMGRMGRIITPLAQQKKSYIYLQVIQRKRRHQSAPPRKSLRKRRLTCTNKRVGSGIRKSAPRSPRKSISAVLFQA
jgi:phage/plasmid-associated DNA primase